MPGRRTTEPTVNPARGAALVVIAVVLGLVLLRNGLDTSEVVSAGRDDTETEAETEDTAVEGDESEGEGSEEETPPTTARPPAEVTVLVMNGTSVNGAAGKYSDAIATAGYQMLEPATSDVKTPTTLVYFAEGFEAEAAQVALAAGAPATVTPAAMPTPPPGDIGAANVVVVIGDDIANLTPTTATTTTTAAG